MENTFKIGDIVELKSGSPKMVVFMTRIAENEKQYINVAYFLDGKIVKDSSNAATYLSDMFKKVEESK